MKKFPSIEQFRHVIREVQTSHDYQGKDELDNPIYRHSSPYPVIDFTGTVKLHGTNASIVKYKSGEVQFQSRENVLSLQKDNAQFMLNMMGKNLDFLFDGIEFADYIAVYGEWCGQGIQKGVALSELPKMFVIFGWKVDDVWVDNIQRFDPSRQIYDIHQFPTYQVSIDFNQPEMVQNKLIELTIEVENECPVGKYFGVSGVGEGIVFSANYNGKRLTFKSKGERHAVSKVKTLNSIDVESLESMNEFVNYAVTENRLKQGLEKLKEMQLPITEKSTGDFLRWLVNDIVKEETDTIVQNGLDVKKLNPLISKAARQWYFNNLEI